MFNNFHKKITAVLFAWVFAGLSVVLISPASAFAVGDESAGGSASSSAFAAEDGSAGGSAGEQQQITMEYRYADGESVVVPNIISQFGREYRLIAKSDPVEEGTLPETRTYTYHVSGLLSAEQLADIRGLGDVKLTPVMGSVITQVERDEVLTGLPTNDIDDLPQYQGDLKLAEASFEVAGKDGYGLPNDYTATTVYRGSETKSFIAYYSGEATYQRTVTDEGTVNYVIVATYAPVGADGAAGMQEQTPLAEDPVPLAEAAGNSALTGVSENPNPLAAFWDSRSVTEKIALLTGFAIVLMVVLFLLFGIRRNLSGKGSRKNASVYG